MARGVGEVEGEVVVGLVGGTGLALLVVAGVFWWLRTRLLREVAAEQASLRAGALRLVDGMTALAGTVEVTDDGGPPVTVTREERRVDGAWKIVGRVVAARPFVLRLSGGAAVRVVPGADPVLRDALEREEPTGERQRQRVARLSAGEAVFVRGVLRVRGIGTSTELAGAERVLLERPRGRAMVLSTEGLGGALERRAGEHAFRAGMLLAAWVLGALPYLDTYLAGALYLLGRGAAPRLAFDVYFWVMLISGSAILGAIGSAWAERPWYRGGEG